MIYWFTGLPGAGKTVLADALAERLRRAEEPVARLDGDQLRAIIANTDYTDQGRKRNVAIMQGLARMLHEQGLTVVVAMVSPFRDQRDMFKAKGSVQEIYVHTTEERGRERFHCYYEPPTRTFLDLDTTGVTIADTVEKLCQALKL